MRTFLGLFLIAHGLIHASYVTPVPPDAKDWPFTLARSWLLGGLEGGTLKAIGIALALVAAAAFAAAGLGLVGVPLLSAAWQALAIVGALASILLLVLFWHAWLVLGIVISAAVLYAIFVARWPVAVFGAS